MAQPRLKDHYDSAVIPAMKDKFGYSNVMQMPKLDKIVLNIGVGEAVGDSKKDQRGLRGHDEDRRPEAGHHEGRNSIATFKLREGMPIGVKVTLRGARMYEFLDRLITIALPRVRDFRGVNAKSF